MAQQFVLRTTDGREFPITGPTSIGREATNTIALPDTSLSRQHATLKLEGDQLWITDNGSANGVFVNGRQIASNKPKALHNGDQIQIGKTELTVAAATLGGSGTVILPVPKPNRKPLVLGAGLAIVLCVLLVAVPVVGFALFRGVAQNSTATVPPSAIAQLPSTVPATVIPTPLSFLGNPSSVVYSTPQPLIEPGRYASQSDQLARAIAELNKSEMDFMGMASGTSNGGPGGVLGKLLFTPNTDQLTDQLALVAANALQVAAMSDDLSRSTAAQDGGSPTALDAASHYASIAKIASALVIEAQGLRDQLTNGLITVQDAAQVIAKYGTRLWNPAANPDPSSAGNPFIASVADPASVPSPRDIAGEDLSALLGASGADIWLSRDGLSEEVKLQVPPAIGPVADRNDPAVVQNLTTTEGQVANPKAAVEVAATILNPVRGNDGSGAPSNEVTASISNSIAVSQPNDPAAPSRPVPAFPNGSAVVVSTNNEEPQVTLLGLDVDAVPGIKGQVAVTTSTLPVTITISNINITGVTQRAANTQSAFEADVTYEFDVTWQAALSSIQFKLVCTGNQSFDIATAVGQQHVTVSTALILYPGTADTFCYADSQAVTLGSASARFLVGDAAEATQRAVKVETDSVSLDLTLTADAVGTLSVNATGAAGAQSINGTANAVSTEVIGTQTAEFQATITTIARQTSVGGPAQATLTPTATATFAPVLLETFFHPGDVFATASTVVLQPGRLYRVCLTGTVFLVNPDKAVAANEIMHINGAGVPVSGCMVIEGNGQIVSITCGEGTPAEDPGGYTVTVTDLGPR